MIDWQDALNRVAGKADLASNLLMLMIETSGKDKVELIQAWQAQDREMLANIAHQFWERAVTRAYHSYATPVNT